jgi:hypothetical protein
MPRFYFHLYDGHGVHPDAEGTLLASVEAAHDYGVAVANELMRNRESRARYWKLDVCEAAGELVAEIDFAQVDRTLDHLPAEVRQSVIHFGETLRTVAETIVECRRTILQSKALMAHAEGKPYLVAENGRRIEV